MPFINPIRRAAKNSDAHIRQVVVIIWKEGPGGVLVLGHHIAAQLGMLALLCTGGHMGLHPGVSECTPRTQMISILDHPPLSETMPPFSSKHCSKGVQSPQKSSAHIISFARRSFLACLCSFPSLPSLTPAPSRAPPLWPRAEGARAPQLQHRFPVPRAGEAGLGGPGARRGGVA